MMSNDSADSTNLSLCLESKTKLLPSKNAEYPNTLISMVKDIFCLRIRAVNIC